MIPEFLTELRALDVTEGIETRRFEVLEPFRVASGVLMGIVTVPAGFTYDGESIPAALHTLVPPFGQSKRAACVHDYLYQHGAYQLDRGDWVEVTRKQADEVYLELALLKGLPQWRALMRYRVLRLVGWRAWNAHRAAE
jgi:hypothetical protein